MSRSRRVVNLLPAEQPAPAYPEYDQVRAEARRTEPRFIGREDLDRFERVAAARGRDWCTAVLGTSFGGIRHVGTTDAQMLVVADGMGLDPPLPPHVLEGRRAHQERQEELERARRQLAERDTARWDTARAACQVPVTVRPNTRGRRTNTGMAAGPLRHVTPDVDAMSGRSRLHRAGRALCETAARRKPLELGDPTDDPATCKGCLASTPRIRRADPVETPPVAD